MQATVDARKYQIVFRVPPFWSFVEVFSNVNIYQTMDNFLSGWTPLSLNIPVFPQANGCSCRLSTPDLTVFYGWLTNKRFLIVRSDEVIWFIASLIHKILAFYLHTVLSFIQTSTSRNQHTSHRWNTSLRSFFSLSHHFHLFIILHPANRHAHTHEYIYT